MQHRAMARFIPQNAICLGIYWARPVHGPKGNTNVSPAPLTGSRRHADNDLGAGSFEKTVGWLHASAPARRAWISGLGVKRNSLGSADVEQRVTPLSRTKDPSHECPDRDVGVPVVEDLTSRAIRSERRSPILLRVLRAVSSARRPSMRAQRA